MVIVIVWVVTIFQDLFVAVAAGGAGGSSSGFEAGALDLLLGDVAGLSAVLGLGDDVLGLLLVALAAAGEEGAGSDVRPGTLEDAVNGFLGVDRASRVSCVASCKIL